MCMYQYIYVLCIIAIKEPDHESVQRLFRHQKSIKSNVGVAHIPIRYTPDTRINTPPVA